MKKQIVSIIIGIFLISLASALTYNITAGESTSFMIPEEYGYYSIVGNSTPIDLNITQEGLNITITPNKYSQSDTFSIIFFNKEKEVIHHYSSGGSTTKYKTEYVYRNITEYIDIGKDDTIVDDTEDEMCEECEISKFNVVPWILLGLIMFYMIISVLNSISRAKKVKEAEIEELDDKDWKIVEDINEKEDKE